MPLKPLKPSKQKRKEKKQLAKHLPVGSEVVPLLPPSNEQYQSSADNSNAVHTKR